MMREERRNGINAVVFFDRFAVPAFFLGVTVLLVALVSMVLMVLSNPLDQPWMAIPGLVWVAIFVIYHVSRGVGAVIRQFIVVNRKDLGNGETS